MFLRIIACMAKVVTMKAPAITVGEVITKVMTRNRTTYMRP